MKRFKIGLATVVAILTMSFTIASHEGAFKKAGLNAKQVYVCVPGIDATSVFDCTNTAGVPPNAPCSFVKAKIFPGDCVFNLVPVGNPQMVCPGGQTFCCAQLKAKGSCPNCQGGPGQTVLAIWCWH